MYKLAFQLSMMLDPQTETSKFSLAVEAHFAPVKKSTERSKLATSDWKISEREWIIGACKV